jgi:O-antigen biosynthesis protein
MRAAAGARGGRREFVPVLVVEAELADPIAVLGWAGAEGRYGSAQLLVRLHGAPLGIMTVPLLDGGPSPAQVADLVWSELGEEIAAHLRIDGLPPVASLPAEGLGHSAAGPRCRSDFEPPVEGALLSVVIPTCRRHDKIADCVRSVLANDYPHLEVLIVDNAPADPRTRRVYEQQFAADLRVRYLREPRPGASRARNMGITFARGPIVVFTDDDVVADHGWLSAIAGTFAQDPCIACVTGPTLPLALDTPAQLWFEQYGGFARRVSPRVYQLHEADPPTRLYPYTAGVLGGGSNLSVRVNMLSAIGGFDVRLGPGTRTRGGEDLDLVLRILRAGGHVGYQPRSLVRHAHRRELSALRRQVFGYGVGASAMLSKWWWKDRAFRRRFLRTLATDRTSLVGPCAPAQDEHSPQPPPSLAALQLLGNAIGPLMWLVAGTGTDGVELAAANEEDAGRERSKAMQ